MIGDETEAMNLADTLRSQGIFIPAIRYPTVRRGGARLRVTLTAAHSTEDVDFLRQRLAAIHLGPAQSPSHPRPAFV